MANAAEALAAAEGARVTVTSQAVVGSRMRDLPGQLERAGTHGHHFDYALIIAGSNDVYHLETGLEQVGQSVGGVVRDLAETGTTVVVVTCPDMSAIVPLGLKAVATLLSTRLERMQQRGASAAGAHTVPCHPDLSGAVRTVKNFFSSDRFHPSNEGYAAVAEHLTPAVLKISKQRRAESEELTPSSPVQAC